MDIGEAVYGGSFRVVSGKDRAGNAGGFEGGDDLAGRIAQVLAQEGRASENAIPNDIDGVRGGVGAPQVVRQAGCLCDERGVSDLQVHAIDSTADSHAGKQAHVPGIHCGNVVAKGAGDRMGARRLDGGDFFEQELAVDGGRADEVDKLEARRG